MNVKETAVKTVPDFIKAKYADLYAEWFSNLSEKNQKYRNSCRI